MVSSLTRDAARDAPPMGHEMTRCTSGIEHGFRSCGMSFRESDTPGVASLSKEREIGQVSTPPGFSTAAAGREGRSWEEVQDLASGGCEPPLPEHEAWNAYKNGVSLDQYPTNATIASELGVTNFEVKRLGLEKVALTSRSNAQATGRYSANGQCSSSKSSPRKRGMLFRTHKDNSWTCWACRKLLQGNTSSS